MEDHESRASVTGPNEHCAWRAWRAWFLAAEVRPGEGVVERLKLPARPASGHPVRYPVQREKYRTSDMPAWLKEGPKWSLFGNKVDAM